jgi:Zn-dependent peptidase ImmA (M78 family)/DNA-binding XRE family transcriptional regulator
MRVGTPGFIAERLTEAREARGYTQTSLAELTGIKAQSISHYEQGRQSPSPEALALLSEKLVLPEHYFLRPVPGHSMSGISYRSLNPAGKPARLKAERRFGWVKEIAGYLRRYIEMPEPRFPESAAPLDAADIEKIADDCRAFWGLGYSPLENMVRHLERIGCIVARVPLDADSPGAFSQWDGRVPYIVLASEDLVAARLRFDAAHELGHLVLHRHLAQSRLDDPEYHRTLEEQASRFASAFLLPARTFRREVWAPTLDALVSLKKNWRCSVVVMISRCEQLGLFDKDQSRRALVNLSRRGWRTEEPLDEQQEFEKPELLASGFRLLIESGIKDRHSLVFELGIGAKDIEILTGLPRGFLTDAGQGAHPLVKLRQDACG